MEKKKRLKKNVSYKNLFAREFRKYLFRILPLLALALTAGARTTAGAVDEGGVVRTTGLEVLIEASELLVWATLAVFAEKSIVTLANTALECAHAIAFGCMFLIHVTLTLALAVAQHLQIHGEGLVDTDLKKKSD